MVEDTKKVKGTDNKKNNNFNLRSLQKSNF